MSTTWNPADKASGITLSNGNLTAASGPSTAGVRSTASNSSGKWYLEFAATNVVAGGTYRIGFANSTQFQTSTLGSSTNGVGYEQSSGAVVLNGVTKGTAATYAAGNTIGVAVDFTAGLIWFAVNGGNWNNSGTANPATGTGGFSISTLAAGPYFLYWEGSKSLSSCTMAPSGGGFTPPSGFTTWDSGGGVTGAGSASAPSPTAQGTGRLDESGSEAATAAAPTAQGTGRLDESGAEQTTVAAPTAQGTGRLDESGSGAAAAPAPTASGSGRLDESGSEAATAAAPTAQATGRLDESGEEQTTVAAPTAQGSGRLDESGSEQATVAAPTAQGTGRIDVSGAEAATAAAPTAQVSGRLDESGAEQTIVAAPTAQATGRIDVSGAEAATAAAPTAQATIRVGVQAIADPAFTLSARRRVLTARAMRRDLTLRALPRVLILSAEAVSR